MSRTIKALALGTFVWMWTADEVAAQHPVYRLGYSGAGITQNLNNVVEKAGLWRKHNLDVKAIYFTSGSLMAQALVGGEIDLTDSNIPTMLNLKAAGILDVKVVAVSMNRILLSFVARKGIRTPVDLKGKRLAISRYGSSSDFITRLLLRYWKLDPDKDVAIIQAGGNDAVRIAALVAGHIDGALIGSYDMRRILDTGCCTNLADLEDLPIEYSRFGIVVPTATIKSRKEQLRRYLQAYTEGIYLYKTRPDLPIALLKREGVKDAEDGYKKIAKALREYPVPEEKGVQTALDSIGTPKSKGAEAKDFIDASLLEEIKKSGFIDGLYGR